MSKTMLIDAAHAEETRVAIVQGRQVEEFDFESKARRQLRGNIYLAKVTRVEPSLQAAFVEYGGNRHGFLAFNEIHPDYYQIPVADREAIMAEAATDEDHEDDLGRESADDEGESEGKLADEERLKRRLMRRYKIQDVIKRRQILLVQVVKDERGGKGAALTTWLSLAGRYCVLMPNTGKGGGISRKITQATDRKRLKAAAASLDVPRGMGLIIRTAGAKRTKAEIKRDYEYLLRLWGTIRETTLRSNAPAMIHEEENLVRRAVRDMFDKDFDGIQVEGVEGWKEARDFMRVLMPSQAKKVHLYRGSKPLFAANGIEEVLHQIHQPVVNLKSGGYLVINQTEALVAIDVNSGRATKERNVEQTAFKTNMEAAAEAARQLRLRDLAGLIVIDFIDMEESKNNRAVEKCLKDALAQDRARIQMGKISGFGLMEISRQRRRLGVIEGATEACPHCHGAGRVRSAESAALMALRAVDIEVGKNGAGVVHLRVPTATALYILNFKRGHLDRLQEQRGVTLVVMVDDRLNQAESAVDRIETNEDFVPPASDFDPADLADDFVYDDAEDEEEPVEEFDDGAVDDEDDDGDSEEGESRREARGPRRAEGEEDGDGGRRRRRGRRGGRRAREDAGEADGFVWVRGRTPSLQDPFVWFDPLQPQAAGDAQPRAESEPRLTDDARTEEGRGEGERGGRRRRRRGRGRGERGEATAPSVEAIGTQDDAPSDVDAANDEEVPAPIPAEPKRRRVRRKVTAAGEGADQAEVAEIAPALDAPTAETAAETSFEPEVESVIPDPASAAEQEPEPGPVAAEPEPKAERTRAPLHSTQDDPAQITAPPPKPKRGWWRL